MNWRSAILFLVCTACALPKPLPDATDATDDLCVASCARAAALVCAESTAAAGPDDVLGTDDDVPCERACADLRAADPTIDPLLRCTADAQDCDAMDACADEVL